MPVDPAGPPDPRAVWPGPTGAAPASIGTWLPTAVGAFGAWAVGLGAIGVAFLLEPPEQTRRWLGVTFGAAALAFFLGGGIAAVALDRMRRAPLVWKVLLVVGPVASAVLFAPVFAVLTIASAGWLG